MPIQQGFSANIEYLQENTYGGGFYNPASVTYLKRPSDIIKNILVTANENPEVLFSISDVDGFATIGKQKEYTLKIEYLLQQGSTSLSEAINRNTDNDLNSYVFLITYGGKYYTIKGCKANTVEIRGEVGEPIVVSIEYIAKEVTVSSTDPVSSYANLRHANALANSYATYSGASISRGGGTFGYGTRTFSITINNNLERIYKVQSNKIDNLVAGKLLTEGTLDIYLEKGAQTEFELVENLNKANIVVSFGISSPSSLTATNSTFKNFELKMNNEDAVVVTSVPFVAETASVS